MCISRDEEFITNAIDLKTDVKFVEIFNPLGRDRPHHLPTPPELTP